MEVELGGDEPDYWVTLALRIDWARITDRGE